MQSAPQLTDEEKIRHLNEERKAQKIVIMNLRQKPEKIQYDKKKNLIIENDIPSSENEAQKKKIQDLSSRNEALVRENGALMRMMMTQDFKEVKEQNKFQTEQFRLLNNQLQELRDVQSNGSQKEINEKRENQRSIGQITEEQLKMKKEIREAIMREEDLRLELETVKTDLQQETTEKESMRLSYEETLRSQKTSYESQLHQARMIQTEYCKRYDDVKIELSKMKEEKRDMELSYKDELTAQRRLSENQHEEAVKREEALRLELKDAKSALQKESTKKEHLRLFYEQELRSQKLSNESALQRATTEKQNMRSSHEETLRSQSPSPESELSQAKMDTTKHCERHDDVRIELPKTKVEKREMELSYEEKLTAQRRLSENQKEEAKALRLELEIVKSALQQRTTEKNEDKLCFEEKLKAAETTYKGELQKAEQSNKVLQKQLEKSRMELRRKLLDCEELELLVMQSSDGSN